MSTVNINVNVTVNVNIEQVVVDRLEGVRLRGQSAMADAFYNVVMANFGSVGFDRPHDWQSLSERYARTVGRSFATLLVTGALKGTVAKDATDPAAARVTMSNTPSVPYAVAHHQGNPPNFGWTARGSGALPARRVFPLDPATDEVTETTARIVEQAAAAAVKEALG